MSFKQPLVTLALALSAATFNANATLNSYNANGVDLVYSSVSNVTWTKDANLLGTLLSSTGFSNTVNAIIAASPIIYDTPNGFDTPDYSGYHIVTASDFSGIGAVSWFGAKAFTFYLNSINYGGSNQWRLPSAGSNPDFGINQIGSELGQLYYNELGALPYPGTNGNDYGILGDGSFETSGSVGPFTKVQTLGYWSNMEHASDPNVGWHFATSSGEQSVDLKVMPYYAWAVAPGQVNAVPVPAAVWLMSTGLIGLLSLKRRKYAG
ncbi:PEP-CTERM sorting domain-containing protein [Methylomonas sp. MK1]|uniref:PEP-CTERM sorting domain-containing protein n=1 Tax=Methylomonas sp. MK1 TaxID=1131552 RepID=UPI0003691976|nr:PEP-CTERM sorting domain-containing protein [Methylomonas sp. MK1]